MSLGEKLYLALVLAAFASFAIVVAFLSWSDRRYDRRMAPEAAPKLDPSAVPKGALHA